MRKANKYQSLLSIIRTVPISPINLSVHTNYANDFFKMFNENSSKTNTEKIIERTPKIEKVLQKEMNQIMPYKAEKERA